MNIKTLILALIIAIIVPSSVNSEVGSFNVDFALGSRGEQVKALQTFLSKSASLYPEALVTGYFGPATERAVKRFQKENGVEQAGRVGPKTRALLNKILMGGTIGYTSSQHVPMINEIFSTSTTPTTAYIFWSANMNTTSEFWLSTSTQVDPLKAQKFVNTQRTMYHSQNLSGLTASTTYYYMMKITDERGNSATSSERSFVTSSI